jgi:hypothetical protein
VDPGQGTTGELGRAHVEAAVDEDERAQATAGVHVGRAHSASSAVGQLDEADARHLTLVTDQGSNRSR